LLDGRDQSSSELDATVHGDPTFQDLHRAVGELRQQKSLRGAGVALVGESEGMRRARRQVELAAATRSPVLIVGSDAWQRRRVAESIPYVRKEGRDEAVIPFDSMLLDENLLSWSLDSLADRGREAATLLFHDVHDLPASAQAFLADRFSRWPAQWRVIATCASIAGDEAMLATLDVRLFHWLSTLVVDLPPLRTRMEDLPLAAQYLVEEMNAASRRQVGGFSQAALDRMHLFDWPGGLAQLRDAVATAHTKTTSPEISVRDLPPFLARAETAAAYPGETIQPIALESVLADIEVNLIRRALELAGGNKTQAATLLGMTRPRLYRRLEQLGMDQ
jgi:DNA-binding NtrC family response regulator